jgi:hypothetical protein
MHSCKKAISNSGDYGSMIMLLYYWVKVINTINYILNRCITHGMHSVTLEECFYGRRPSINHIKVFDVLDMFMYLLN